MLFPLLHALAREPGIPRRNRVRKARAKLGTTAQSIESKLKTFSLHRLEFRQAAANAYRTDALHKFYAA